MKNYSKKRIGNFRVKFSAVKILELHSLRSLHGLRDEHLICKTVVLSVCSYLTILESLISILRLSVQMCKYRVGTETYMTFLNKIIDDSRLLVILQYPLINYNDHQIHH